MADIDSIVVKLSSLEKEINKAKISIATLHGEKKGILDRLKKDFNIETIDEAEEKLNSIKIKISKLENDLEIKFNKLKSTYEW